jgi:hypothetical protein
LPPPLLLLLLPPPLGGGGGLAIVTAAAVTELLAAAGSNTDDCTAAELLAAPTVAALTLMVAASDAAGANVPRSQVTMPAACVQVAPVALTNVSRLLKVRRAVAAAASPPAALLAVSVYENCVFCVTLAVELVSVTARSLTGAIVTAAFAELLVATGSGFALATSAVAVAAPAAMVSTVMTTTPDAPGASAPRLQVTVEVPVHEAPVALAYRSIADNARCVTTSGAAMTPWLVAVSV